MYANGHAPVHSRDGGSTMSVEPTPALSEGLNQPSRSSSAFRNEHDSDRPRGRREMVDLTLLVTSDPAVACGVADYTDQLARAFRRIGVAAAVERLPSWSLRSAWRAIRARADDPDHVFHIQYPSLGMGVSPAPGLFPLLAGRRRAFLTLHEFEIFNPVRKAYMLPHSFGGRLVFTSEHELGRFKAIYPWAGGAIIPVGNNITAPENLPLAAGRRRLVCFGQIAPGKGIEEFLEAVAALRAAGDDIPCAVIGADLDPSSEISRRIGEAAERLGIERRYNLSAQQVAEELGRSGIAYLPFPGGVSDKRGSALACLQHGLAVITRHSALTPDWWRKTTYDARNAQDAARTIAKIAKGDAPHTPDPAALEAAMAERSWISIARAHVALYGRCGARSPVWVERSCA
jgi:glycosyltransferase involved in cell wall biosynthesis